MRTRSVGVFQGLIRPLLQAGLLLLAAAPALAVTGYSIAFFGGIYAFDPVSGAVSNLGNTGLQGEIFVAKAPGGNLYAVQQFNFPTRLPSLYRIDPATAESELIGSLGIPVEASDLTVDASGGLWMAADGDLHTVDPQTGAAALVGASADFLRSIAFRDGVLYGIIADFPADPQLVTVDMDTGIPTVISGFDPVLEGVTAMDFDGTGALWVATLFSGVIDPPTFVTEFWRVEDLATGEAEEHANFIEDIQGGLRFESFAIAPEPFDAITEIPTLGGFGMALLVSVLAAAALVTLRRRF